MTRIGTIALVILILGCQGGLSQTKKSTSSEKATVEEAKGTLKEYVSEDRSVTFTVDGKNYSVDAESLKIYSPSGKQLTLPFKAHMFRSGRPITLKYTKKGDTRVWQEMHLEGAESSGHKGGTEK